MKGTDCIDQLAALAPVRDTDLAAAAQTPAARELLAEILSRPFDAGHGARPLLSAPKWLTLAGVAVAAAAALAFLLPTGGGNANAAAATLRQAARTARTQAPLLPGPGQYLYTKSVNAYLNTVVPVGGAAAAYDVLVPHVRQIWLGPDGGRLYEIDGAPRFLTARDRERWAAAGKPNLTEPPSENELPPAPALDLPSDPDLLYARLERDARGHGDGHYGEMWTLIGDSLRETSATPEQRAALYEVAARLPGVALLGRVADSIGRPGIGVARDADGIRSTLIFDSGTSALLEEKTVALDDNPYGYQPGTRVGYSTYLTQKIVDSATATT